MKLCLLYNFAQHYRTNIFMLLDQSLDIDFVFGDNYLNVKKMDYSLLRHNVVEVKNRYIGPFMWQPGTVKYVFKDYDKYILLGNPYNLSTWLILVLGRIKGKKTFLWTHGWYGKESRFERLVKKLFFSFSDGVLLYGDYARKLMIKEGIDPRKLTTIHNSLMYDEQLLLRRNLKSTTIYSDHFHNYHPTVIFVGRLTRVKKLDLVLRAQSLCKKSGTLFNMVFVGDGEVADYLKSLSVDLKLVNNVWFYGPSYDEKELSRLLFDADLCVAPGNIGLTAMHAMVYGCPCISHNDFKWQMPEFEAIQEGITGDFYEKDNVDDLADRIASWFRKHASDRESVRKACYMEIDAHWNPHIQLEIIKKAIGE